MSMLTKKLKGITAQELLRSLQAEAIKPAIGVSNDPARIKQKLEMLAGDIGSGVDQAITLRDLIDMQLVQIADSRGVVYKTNQSAEIALPVRAPSPPVNNQSQDPCLSDFTAPPTPTGVTVTPGFSVVFVEWARPEGYECFAYAEIFRAEVDDIGQAAQIAQTTFNIYADNPGRAGVFYYWVRFVSKADVRGNFQSVTGLSGEIGNDPAYIFDLLTQSMLADGQNVPSVLYVVEEPLIINGVNVPAGVYVRDAFIANGTITNAKIANAAIDNAKIANLSAEKINAGFLSADRIQANSITGEKIVANSITADRINSRGLSIRDEQGNIILAAGTPLDYSFVGGSTAPEPNATRNVNAGMWAPNGGFYLRGDEVTYQGSSYTALIPHFASNATAPPTLPETQNIYWQLRAAKGDQGISYEVEIESTNGNIFRPGFNASTLLIAHVFLNGVEITDELPASRFRWRRISFFPRQPPDDDASWNALYAQGYKQISVTIDTVEARATFHCDITE